MAREAVQPADGEGRWTSAWLKVSVGLGLVVLACAIYGLGEQLGGVRFLLILAGTILAGRAVEQMLRRLRPDEQSRLEVGSLTAVASLVPLLGHLATDESWDSARMVLVALIAAGVVGTGLILLPVAYRKVAVVVLILLHFGGILSAVLSVPPQNLPAPWLSAQAQLLFYRPYLNFAYLTNPYHFYSPEPGPPNLLYAYVIYENEDTHEPKGKWLHFPDRNKSPVTMHFQRLLALCESISQQMPNTPDLVFNKRAELRKEAGENAHPPLPMHPNILLSQQFAEPQPFSKMLLASYARHLYRTHQELENEPKFKFHSVKIYRVVHSMLDPVQFLQGHLPREKTLYLPYFQGEFNERGEVFDGKTGEVLVDDLGEPIPDKLDQRKDLKDRFLYWLLPILPDGSNKETGIMDCMELHARSMPTRSGPAPKEEKEP